MDGYTEVLQLLPTISSPFLNDENSYTTQYIKVLKAFKKKELYL
ncbi:MAG: hypothetical protein TRG1_1525 [Flavobacteriaceae bacterium FS1-H7996/R]|nr:MAG: hypothetical protein TRG1_1525 [Flavobacteriaceae bacterium FS1-H7996/R]